jgi:hypothetical protein
MQRRENGAQRNPGSSQFAQRVTFLGLEFEDLFVVLGLAAFTNIFGHSCSARCLASR